MPRIPDYAVDTGVLARNPAGVDMHVAEQGKAWDAVARTGNTMENVGTQLLQQQKSADDVNDASTKLLKAHTDLQKFQQDWSLNNPDNYDGYTQATQKFVDDRMQQDSESAVSNESRQMYNQQAKQQFGHVVMKAQATEFQKRAESANNQLLSNIDGEAVKAQDNYDPEDLYGSLHNLKNNIYDRKDIDPGAKEHLWETAKGKVAKGALQGMFTDGSGDTEQGPGIFKRAMDLLNGENRLDKGAGDDSLVSGLTPDERFQWMNKMQSGLAQTQEIGKHEINLRFQNYIAKVQDGGEGDPNFITAIQKAQKNGTIEGLEASQMVDTVKVAASAGMLNKELKSLPMSQWDQKVAEWKSKIGLTDQEGSKSDFNYAQRSRFASVVDQQMANISKERKLDPAEAALTNIPGIAEKMTAAGDDPAKVGDAIQGLFAAQKQMGLPQRILQKSEAQQMVAGLSSDSASQVIKQMQSYKDKYGDHFSRVFDELTDNKLDPRLWAASYFPNKNDQERVVNNVINSKGDGGIEKNFKTNFDSKTSDTLHAEVRAKMAPFFSAMAGSNPDASGQERPAALEAVVATEAKRMMVNQEETNPTKAVAKAMGLINQNFTRVNAANSNIMVPIAGNKPNLIGSFMEANLRPDALQKMGIPLPTSLPNNERYKDQNPAIKSQNYYQDLSEHAQWVNPSGNALMLQTTDALGNKKYVIGKDGNYVRFDMGDVSRGTGNASGELYQRALDHANGSPSMRLFPQGEKVLR
jgi:hypothetical protein